MRCVVDQDLRAYADRVTPWLLCDPVANNVAYTLIHQRLSGAVPTEPDALWLRVLDEHDHLVGVALRTPPFGLLLTRVPDAAVEVLVAEIRRLGIALPSAHGPAEVASAFAARYAELTGTDTQPQLARLYRLDRVEPPVGVPGKVRAATEADRELLVDWTRAFLAEADPQAPPGDAANQIDGRLGQDHLLWLWEDAGEPVSMAWLSQPAAGVVRVSGVYTPPDLRGRGYASGCVAAVSQGAIDRGAVACMLYTDLANPTSNSIYQKLGYYPVTDAQQWRFVEQVTD
jgi:predicted GNAT family acetyltransferase